MMLNPMQIAGRQIQQSLQGNPMAMLMQMKQRGMSPQQAFDELMKNPDFVQSVNVARQQYPNMSFVEIARKNGYDLEQYFAGNLF
jgi:hypothetical protein